MKKQRFHVTRIEITGGEMQGLLREKYFDGGTGRMEVDTTCSDDGDITDLTMTYTIENIDT